MFCFAIADTNNEALNVFFTGQAALAIGFVSDDGCWDWVHGFALR
jgi:hypothetical protein